MPRMDVLRKLLTFKRQTTPATEPASVEVNATQARHLGSTSRHATGNGASSNREASTAVVEPKPNKTRSLHELSRGYDAVFEMVQKINNHLDQQAKRSERVIEVMDRLPEVLDTLPEIQRQSTRLLEALSEHLQQSKTRDESLHNTLDRLRQTTDQQTELLSLVQQQIDGHGEVATQMTNTLGGVREALGKIASSNEQTVKILNQTSKAAEQRESQLIQTLGRTQKWMIGAMVFCGAVSAAALGVATAALLM